MERTNLTPERIRKATCPPGKQQTFLWDKEGRLGVRITTAGAKAFIFESKLNRSTIRRTIGACSAWTVEDARKEANRLQRLIDRGIDPRELEKEEQAQKAAEKAAQEDARKEAEARQRYTLKALCDEYVKLLEARDKDKSAGATKSAFKCHVFEPHPTLAATPAREITSHQIAEVIRGVAEQGKERTAGILRSYLSAAYNAARKAPHDPKLPSALIAYRVDNNPVEVISTIPVNAGDRTLTADELKAYIEALGEDLHDLALKLALYAGGQRMAQLLRAQVSDYDPKAKTLRLLDGKGKRREPRIHLLPLGPVAAGIVEKLAEGAKGADSPALFASRGGTVDENTPGRRVADIVKATGGEPFTLRDIRRTCETMLASLGISRDIRAQLLSHGISGVQATHYDRHDYMKEKRAALQKWERHLDTIVNGKQAAKVVNLR